LIRTCDSISCRIGTEASMGKPYSQDLRERVIAAVDGGLRVYGAAPLFQVSVSYIYKALIRRRLTGETAARQSRGGPRPKLAPHDDALRARVAAEPDITLAELRAWLVAERGIKVSTGCLWNRLQFLGLPLKKSRSELPSRIGRMSLPHGNNGVQARAS
jgi:transposase